MKTNWYLIRFDAGRVIALESDSYEAASEVLAGHSEGREPASRVLLADEPELIALARSRSMVLEVHPSPPREIRRQLKLGGVRPLLALAS